MTYPLQDRLALAFVFVVALIALPIVMTKIAERARDRNEDPRIVEIRQWQRATERALPSYRSETRELEGFSAEGGELTAYFASDTLEKLSGIFAGESGRATEQYYVRGSAPYFIFRTAEMYDKPLSGRVARSSTERLYFHGDSLIRWIDSAGKQLPLTSRAAQVEQHNDLLTARTLVECAKHMSSKDPCEAASDDQYMH